MTDLLVRDIPDDLKHLLAVRAAENGRSQSAEALSIIRDTLQPQKKRGIFEILREAAEECGGVELERPTWKAREFSFNSE